MKLPKKLFKTGKIRTLDKKIVGKHKGLLLYTIGQRRGVELGGMRKPNYVVGFDREKNELLVGENEALFSKKLKAKKLSWVNEAPQDGATLLTQLRFRSEANQAKIHLKKTLIEVEFTKPQRAITPGQTVPFYRKNVCLGCGEIC